MDSKEYISNLNSEQGSVSKKTSMTTLIIWNVAKVLENNPSIDLKPAIKAAQDRLERYSRDVNGMMCQYPEERHLACALLAWHQLGHDNADSLYDFVVSQQKTKEKSVNIPSEVVTERPSGVNDCYAMGPVVTLPVDAKIVMRLDSVSNSKRPIMKKDITKDADKNIMDKIDAACCLESGCAQRLAEMDVLTGELRSRAARLARREAERVDLLERAEVAWKDLEMGYQRRINAAEEKEHDLTNQVQKLIEERNENKNVCKNLTDILKEMARGLEKDRSALTKLEKEVCDRACLRLRKTEEAANVEATLAEQQCKASQLDRDLRYKEEQANRKMLTLQNELESAKTLTHEAERAMRCELGAIRDQIKLMSDQLLQEDNDSVQIKKELDEMRQEKTDMIEDLEGCKMMCDNKMQSKMDELKMKRANLAQLKDKVMECRCKLPVDSSVGVKRTPSLVVQCYCTSEDDKLMDACSCTSLRTSLMSNLLSDLFRGLQTELGDARTQMPCQLLKCLEDKHNWDRASAVKSNLRNYFSQLLIGELDIAIATCIENYHFKWIGASCADVGRVIPDTGDLTKNDDERALEERAQKLATKLAEQLFQEKADELAYKAKNILHSGPPPCKCNTQSAAFPCLVGPMSYGNSVGGSINNGNSISYWRRTLQNVSQLRAQIEDMKKESVKKEDLISMENKIAQIVHQISISEKETIAVPIKELNNLEKENKAKMVPLSFNDKVNNLKKKQVLNNSNHKKSSKCNTIHNSNVEKPYKNSKTYRKQSFAINVCLCDSQKEIPSKLKNKDKILKNIASNESKSSISVKNNIVVDSLQQNSSVKQTQPITNFFSQDVENVKNLNMIKDDRCPKNCVCFHKKPSNTSLDKMLSNLKKNDHNLINLKNEEISCEFNEDKTSNTVNAEMNTIQETLNDANVIDSEEKIQYSNISNYNLEKNSGNMNKVIPLTIESEYMGEINLDKSNDVISKCIDEEHNADTNYTVKYIEKNIMCNCISASEVLEPKLQCKITDDEKNTVFKLNSFKKPYATDNLTSDFNNYVKSSFLHDTGCFLKFLGVTLTDIKSKNDLNKTVNVNNQENFIKKMNNHEIRNMELHKPYDVSDSHKKEIQGININNKLSSCQCKIKISEFRKYVDDTFSKQQGDFYSKIDKEIDSQSFMNSEFNKKEFCICCENSDSGEVKNLEVNTFQLLQDHLKEKLDEFKRMHCISSCIKREVEEKLFVTILDGVKDIIESSTVALKCKCPTEGKLSDNFNRAYNLLQEYLRTKIKRVQCSCSITEVEYSVLPIVIEKVRKLIENDFQRLKNICKCNIDKNIEKEVSHGINTSLEIPEKDIFQNKSVSEHLQLYKLHQNTSCQVISGLGLNAKSCEAIIIEVEKTNKAIGDDAIMTDIFGGSLETQTSKENQSVLPKEYKNIFLLNKATDYKYPKYDTYLNALNLFLTDPKSYYFQALSELQKTVSETGIETKNKTTNKSARGKIKNTQNSLFLNNKNYELKETVLKNKTNIDNVKENDVEEKIKTPYMATCNNNVGVCDCVQSIIQDKKEKLSDSWNRVTKNVIHDQNEQYFSQMHLNRSINTAMVQRKESMDDFKETTILLHESQVNTEEKNVTLKTSCDKLKDIYARTSSQYERSINTETDIMTSNKEWHECESSPLSNRNKNKQSQNLVADGSCSPLNDSKFNNCSKTENKANDIGLSTSYSRNCDCNMVPICHVKMLINSIENKLVESKCTCDSMMSEVCPVHYIIK